MDTARIFTNGRSQAVRLPKAYRFDADEIMITRIGDLVILYPKDKGWDLLARGIEGFTRDAMDERRQPTKPQRRQAL